MASGPPPGSREGPSPPHYNRQGQRSAFPFAPAREPGCSRRRHARASFPAQPRPPPAPSASTPARSPGRRPRSPRAHGGLVDTAYPFGCATRRRPCVRVEELGRHPSLRRSARLDRRSPNAVIRLRPPRTTNSPPVSPPASGVATVRSCSAGEPFDPAPSSTGEAAACSRPSSRHRSWRDRSTARWTPWSLPTNSGRTMGAARSG